MQCGELTSRRQELCGTCVHNDMLQRSTSKLWTCRYSLTLQLAILRTEGWGKKTERMTHIHLSISQLYTRFASAYQPAYCNRVFLLKKEISRFSLSAGL